MLRLAALLSPRAGADVFDRFPGGISADLRGRPSGFADPLPEGLPEGEGGVSVGVLWRRRTQDLRASHALAGDHHFGQSQPKLPAIKRP